MRFTTVLLCVLFALAACTTAAPEPAAPAEPTPTFACPDGTIVEDIANCPPVEVEEPEVVAEEPEVDPDAEITGEDPRQVFFNNEEQATGAVAPEKEALLDRIADKAKNGYAFTYREVSDNSPSDSAFIGGRFQVNPEGDTAVTWDRNPTLENTRIAKAITINGETELWCQDCEEGIAVDYVLPTLPVAWLEAMTDMELLQTQSLGGFNVQKFSGMVDGVETNLYADSFSGVPVRVEQGENVYEYDSLSMGNDKDAFDLPTN